MARIKILAVEDDDLYADNLRMVAEKLNYDLLGILSNPEEVLLMVDATKPDVLLMDIDLGTETDGIELTGRINDLKNIPVIYVTSFRSGEIMDRAMATRPEGYILKPYDAAQLEAAIELAVFRKQHELEIFAGQQDAVALNAIFVKEGTCLTKVMLDDITCIKAYDKYCFVFTREKKYFLNTPFKNVLPRFPKDNFLQVHRSYLINLKAIDKIKPQQNILEVAGMEVPVSKSFKTALYGRLVTI